MKNILITGATSGIGKQLAREYARAGNHVIACGRNRDRLDALETGNPGLRGLAFDVADRERVSAAAESIDVPLDLVILNAGDCEYIDDPMRFDGELFARIISVNLVSLGYCVEALLPRIRRGGRLVIVSSSATFLPFPRAGAYGAAKAGADYLARTLAIELQPHGIEVTLVRPGFVKTPLTDKNNFDMPMRVSTEFAARAIMHGIGRGRAEICFPRRFTWILRLLAMLPASLWQRIAGQMMRGARA